MLFVWARAHVFAELNGLPMFNSSWTQLRLGPLLRRERHSRLYAGYFQDPENVPKWRRAWATVRYRRVQEPAVALLETAAKRTLYEFHAIPPWSDYFADLRAHRDLVRRGLLDLLTPSVRQRFESQAAPCLAVHVRMGDFRALKPGEDFAKVGLVRTPLDYFVDLIAGIRELAGVTLPVTLFSDGSDADLQPLLALPQVQRAERNPDIVDMLLMSRSRLLVCSAGSTFSYWGGFLSDAPVLLHPEHVHKPHRDADANARFFEGGVRGPAQGWPALLKSNIAAIASPE